jgi:predicted nucleic acid-binding protein
MIYLLDTNTVSDYLEYQPVVTRRFEDRMAKSHQLVICSPVYYELRRGLLWRNNHKKLEMLQTEVLDYLTWETVNDEDWSLAARFWADARAKGKQLDDIDPLIAALAHRLNATIASSDTDFDVLPVTRESWRDPQ